MDIPYFIYLSVHGYLSCFYFLPTLVLLRAFVYTFLWRYMCLFLEYIPKSEIMVTLLSSRLKKY